MERLYDRTYKIRQKNSEKQPGLCKRYIKLWIFLGLAFLSWSISVGMQRARADMLQRGISREVLRFHVLANSDREEDQQIKIKVRDDVLEWLEGQLTLEEENDLQLMESRIQELLPEIEKKTESILKKNGFDYGAQARMEKTYFPERTYGTCTFPAGEYTALRILLGDARGQNWWCILFPRLCFLDCVHAVLPRQSQEQLQKVLTEEEYESLFDPSKDEYKISFKYF